MSTSLIIRVNIQNMSYSVFPDLLRQNIYMSRPPQTERTDVKTFVRSKVFVRSSCVQRNVRPDFRAFKFTYDRTFVHSKSKIVRSNFEIMSRISWFQRHLCPEFHAFKSAYVYTFVRLCPYLSSILFIKLVHNVSIMYSFQVLISEGWWLWWNSPAVATF